MPYTFDPGKAQARVAWEKAPGDPLVVKGDGTTLGGWHDFLFSGEKLGMNSELVERTAITRAKAAAKQLPGKLVPGGEIDFDTFNAEQDWFWLAMLVGACDAPVLLETGVYRHRFHAGATGVVFPQTAQLRIDRDDGLITNFREFRLAGVQFTLPTRGLIQMKLTTVVRSADYWGDPVPTTGNTSTALPRIRGLSDAAFNAEDVLAKISATDSTTVTLQTKRGGPTAYSGTQVIPKGVWTWLKDETGAMIGDRSLKIEIFLPLTGTYVVGDEWTFPALVTPWTPTYPLNVPANEISGGVSKDGTDIEVDTATLTVTSPAEAKFGYGGRQAKRTRVRGQRKAMADLAREYQPDNFKRQLELLGSFQFRADIRSGVSFGASGVNDYGLQVIMAGVSLSGKGASAESLSKMDEPVKVEAFYPTGDGTFPDDIYFDVVNSIPSLTAI